MKQKRSQKQVGDYRHDARRKNNPPAGIGPTYEVEGALAPYRPNHIRIDLWKGGVTYDERTEIL